MVVGIYATLHLCVAGSKPLKTAQVVLGVCTSLRQCTSGARLVHRVL